MYSTCLFCHASLGANDVVEHFPVGRCLAFDAARGRLWVVCAACGRWNLTPLEERWEAVEQCERAFRGTALRAQTEQVGLARLRGGLELIRVGRPLRPELALWRYGDALGRRHRRHLRRTGALALAAAGAGAAVFAGAVAVAGTAVWLTVLVGATLAVSEPGDAALAAAFLSRRRRAARFREGGSTYVVRQRDVLGAHLFHDLATREMVLDLAHELDGLPAAVSMHSRFTGDAALRVLGKLLPQFNRAGGSDRQVQGAVRLIERAGDAAALAPLAIRAVRRAGITTLAYFPPEIRLALEMAAHEEGERRALEGQLAWLEAAWREAEELASIADSLTPPPAAGTALARRNPGAAEGV